MKKRTLALALSFALSISMMSPAASSDFMEDDAFLAEEIAVQAETTAPAPAAEETIDIPFEVETLQEDTIVPDASGDFVDEVEMKDLLEEQETIETEEPQEADTAEDTTETETAADDDFASEEEILADLPALAGQAGWTSVSNAGTVNYLYTTGEADGFGNPVFYTDKDGIVTIDGAEYCFDENGVMKTGKVKVGSKYIYLMDAEHATLKAGITNEEPNPINSDLGQRQKSYWNWNGTAFEYYTATGYLTTVKNLIDAKIQNGTYAG
ncbi:MAG: hypothetical protein KBT01_06835, partial [Clostridiales bacterium]|nr:hypothetical protein [Candidatus Blautia equi]